MSPSMSRAVPSTPNVSTQSLAPFTRVGACTGGSGRQYTGISGSLSGDGDICPVGSTLSAAEHRLVWARLCIVAELVQEATRPTRSTDAASGTTTDVNRRMNNPPRVWVKRLAYSTPQGTLRVTARNLISPAYINLARTSIERHWCVVSN